MCYLLTLPPLILFIVLSEPSSLSFLFSVTFLVTLTPVAVLTSFVPSSLMAFLLSLLSLIIGVFVSTSSLFVFFMMYELSLFPLVLIILLFGYQPEKLQSSVYLLLYTVVCSSPLLYFSVCLATSLVLGFSGLGSFASFLVCLSFMVKSPLYTLHAWLPNAHVEAPLIGSIILAGVILKLGSYGLLLLSPNLCGNCSLYLYLTLLGGVMCSSLCCRSWDIKSLVAYSSVVHIGVVTLGALSGTEIGFWAAQGMVVGHSMLSPLIFSLAYELYCSSGSRNFIYGHTSSVSSSLLFIISICSGLNFGLPPFLNFWVEVSLFTVMGSVFSFSLLPLMLTALLTFFYSILFYVLSCGGPVSSSLQFFTWIWIYAPPVLCSLLISATPSVLIF